MKSKKQSLFITLALGLGLGLTLALLWLLSGGASEITLAQAGTGVIRVATTGSDAPGCGSQASPCRTLQYAVDQAGAGDEVLVATGVYTGVHVRNNAAQVVYVDKNVTIRGGYDNGFQQSFPLTRPTVVDAEGQGRVIHIKQYISSTIEGLWITGGNAAHAIQSPGHGGGIYSYDATLIIANSVISHNVATTSTSSYGHGGGMYIHGSAMISGNRVISNVASTSYAGRGGGMYITHGDGMQVINNQVLSNTGVITGGQGFGGGIYLTHSDGAVVDGNHVEYNMAQARLAPFNGAFGGGICCFYSNDAVFSNNVIRHNTANAQMSSGGGGGMIISVSDRVRVQGNTLEGNTASMTASGWGGGLDASRSHDLLIDANRVLSNSARYGGGLRIAQDTNFTMTNNVVAANVSSNEGGGMTVYADASGWVTGTLLHNTFAANNRGSGEGRSAIQIDEPYVSLVLTNNLIYSHTYGVIVVPTSTVRLYNTLFYANDTDTSGAGEIYNTDPITGQDPLLDADYHLLAGSPAIDAGVDAGVTTDIDGEPRPFGLNYDIGADEFAWRHIYLSLVVRNY
jgi:hypothetical protein